MSDGERSPSPLSSLVHLLHRAGQQADARFVRHLGNDRLTPRQYIVLQAVAERDGLNQMGIMAATGIDRSSTADLVGRLVALRLLQRRRTRRDARSYAVRLTAEGRRLVQLGADAARATEEALLASLPRAQRTTFMEALEEISTLRE